jgi:hypothetical protein
MLIDQEPLVNVEVLAKDEVIGLNKDTVVPSGVAPE